MKNYYEILQVDKNASSEIINKAYKILAKKYHPDLQETEEKKKEAEEQIKLINDAYDTLSDKIKRKDYDVTLQNSFVSPEEYDAILGENLKLKQELNILQNKFNSFTNHNYNNFNNNSTNYNNDNYYKHTQNENYNNINYNNKKYTNSNYYNTQSQNSENYKLTLMDYIKFYTKYFFIKLLKLIGCLAIIGITIFLLLKLPFFSNLFTSNNYILLIVVIAGLIYFYGNRE